MKVLVADDSGVMRKMVLRSLESIGITECSEASDGNAAWELFQSEPFDLVLTDWNMPNKDGLQLVRDIRASGSQTPILMITTVEQQGEIQKALEAGVNDLLTKPFSADDLISKIDCHVSC